jgi:hypothetical protein
VLHLAGGVAALPTVTAGGLALAQSVPATRAKGPLVWLDMDQKDLDDSYTQSVYAPNMQTILERCTRNGELVRERIGAPKRFAYGPTAIEGIEFFPPRRRMPRHMFTFMVGLGARSSHVTPIIRPRCSSMQGPTSWCPISTTSSRPVAI